MRKIRSLSILLSSIAIGSCAGTSAAVQVVDEPAGANCPAGGQRIDVGPDDNDDGIPDDVTSTSYVCNGTDGNDAVSYLTASMTEPAGANCANGGVRIAAGPDTNGNSMLDATEITSSSYVCSGANAIP